MALGSEAKMGLLVLGSLLILASAVVSLMAGILGVKNAAIPEKAQTCINFGLMTAGFTVLGSIVSMIGGSGFKFGSLITGLALPAVYLVGAFQNKNLI